MRNQLQVSQYLVLVLRLVVFIRFDIGTRSAVARKLLLIWSHVCTCFHEEGKTIATLALVFIGTRCGVYHGGTDTDKVQTPSCVSTHLYESANRTPSQLCFFDSLAAPHTPKTWFFWQVSGGKKRPSHPHSTVKVFPLSLTDLRLDPHPSTVKLKRRFSA